MLTTTVAITVLPVAQLRLLPLYLLLFLPKLFALR